ncbi:MAG: hypothetical protein Q4C22_07550 [Bacillota bacterium]|nr:hypothetical protein [Bacillota bacterium]
MDVAVDYKCTLATPVLSGTGTARVGEEALEIQGEQGGFLLNYAQVRSLHLHNYHFLLDTPQGPFRLSQMGQDTEGFMEELWLAYGRRSRESLFVETVPLREAEGDYRYSDQGGTARGTAKVCLYEDCICILPMDNGARRIPLCFVTELSLNNYTIRIGLDTGEEYEAARLGRDTIPFFEHLSRLREEAQSRWQRVHKALEGSLETLAGEAGEAYARFREACGGQRLISGFFRLPAEGEELSSFWLCGLGPGTAAVELVTGEKAATYLYRFSGGEQVFEARLRHAMEAMGLNRELIYLEEGPLMEKPLYSMAVERNPHLRFLRAAAAGRVIHTESWGEKVAEHLKGAPAPLEQ